MARLFQSAEESFGGIDALVNNVGVMKLAPINESDHTLNGSQIAVNLTGTFNTLCEAKRLRGGGRIISVSSSVMFPR